ncbi:hypothetical protein IV203_015538 [Nitzschia inconspicua]|uniref:Uncharacterized protein n=1 Tax=Nitzschia inconspicua TaxID=303405 RepID=A0A9K3PVR3_9STRA|nr:hypothetical protein IV203_015538 [Nitzschia inconspicua]
MVTITRDKGLKPSHAMLCRLMQGFLVLLFFVVVSMTLLGRDLNDTFNYSAEQFSSSIAIRDMASDYSNGSPRTSSCLVEPVKSPTAVIAAKEANDGTMSPPQNSSTATVMAMATGYRLDAYKRFVGSLRKSGYQGHIILAVSPKLEPETEDREM